MVVGAGQDPAPEVTVLLALIVVIGAPIVAVQQLAAGDVGGAALFAGLAVLAGIAIYIRMRRGVGQLERDKFWSGWR
jgi:hypothetical protein